MGSKLQSLPNPSNFNKLGPSACICRQYKHKYRRLWIKLLSPCTIKLYWMKLKVKNVQLYISKWKQYLELLNVGNITLCALLGRLL